MGKLIVSLVLAGIATLGCAGIAAAAEKKPMVCFVWQNVSAEGKGAFSVCYDGKKPVILTSTTMVTILSADGSPVDVLVGYR